MAEAGLMPEHIWSRFKRLSLAWLFILAVRHALPVLHATAAQEDTLRTVLARAGAYIADYRRQMSSIVAEEHYIQAVWYQGRAVPADVQPERRELRSDVLLVTPSGARDWLQLRDVFEVDGLPVVDRSERLTKLLDESSPFPETQIARIMNESARYNIGPIQRTVNAPLLPLMFLEPGHQYRFKFKRTIDGRPATTTRDEAAPPGYFQVSTEVWVVEYRETEPGTFIRTPGRRDLPSHGRFWIEPTTGRVLMSELINDDREVRATIDVSYQSEPLVGFLVPVEMRERYEGRRDGVRIEGTATYGRFRQVELRVDQPFGPIGK
jgi:hypothetical protein